MSRVESRIGSTRGLATVQEAQSKLSEVDPRTALRQGESDMLHFSPLFRDLLRYPVG